MKVRTLAAYQVVHHVHPRPVTPQDEIGLVVGKAIDDCLSRFSYEVREGRHPSRAAMARLGRSFLEEGFRDADLSLDPEELERIARQLDGVLQAFRKSPALGLPRPRTRLVLIGEEAGIYAQPDYWDTARRFYEMKSYRAVPPPPDVALQMELFQLAFPGFESLLLCIDRHHDPVETTVSRIPPMSPERKREVLDMARALALEQGEEKTLEYIDNPIVRQPLGG